MGTIVIDRRGSEIGYADRAMTIRQDGLARASIPLRMIDMLIISAATRIDSALLSHLAQNGTGIVILPPRGNRQAGHLFGLGHGDAARRLGQYRLCNSRQRSLPIARRLLSLKINGHIRLLRRMLTQQPACRHGIETARRQLRQRLFDLRVSQSVAQLRGVEGAASAAFFKVLSAVLPDSAGFNGRNRRPPRDPANACLSLGYTLAHAEAIRAASSAGLDPCLGFLHEPSYGRESLACDLVELVRPRVDALVWRLFADRVLRADHFSMDGEACRMNKHAREQFYPAYIKHAALQRVWLRRACLRLAALCREHVQQDAPHDPVTGVNNESA